MDAVKANELAFCNAAAQRKEMKQAIQKLSTLEKVQQVLEESEAMASINPANKLAYQLTDYVAVFEEGGASFSCYRSLRHTARTPLFIRCALS